MLGLERSDRPRGPKDPVGVRCVRKAEDRLNEDPADQPLPDWADTWMREYERGSDMTTFYPRSVPG